MPPKKALKRKEPFPSSSSEKQPKRARNEKETPLDWLELPRDMTASIPRRLGAIEILETAQKACMSWRNLCKDPTVWHAVDMCNSCNCIRELRRLPYDLKNSNPRLESCCPLSLGHLPCWQPIHVLLHNIHKLSLKIESIFLLKRLHFLVGDKVYKLST